MQLNQDESELGALNLLLFGFSLPIQDEHEFKHTGLRQPLQIFVLFPYSLPFFLGPQELSTPMSFKDLKRD